MASQILLDPLQSPTRRRDNSTGCELAAVTTESPLLGELAATRRVEVSAREAFRDLRSNDPATADRVDAAFAEMPCIGDTYHGFKLALELGHGAFGRVYLARQVGLAERYVALKVAADLHGESQRLAQLQHTNIVPIYSEHRVGNLHAVCMPFCGSTTLADVLKNLREHHSLPTSGKHLVSTLFNRQSTVRTGMEHSEPSSHPNAAREHPSSKRNLGGPAPTLAIAPGNLSTLGQMSFVDAVIWIMGRLADGLAHAHERGIIHRDLKPANVLICDDGQPMLLDFNLAEDMKLRDATAVALVGGTLPYMSPEQLIAYRDGKGNVDGRSDIYALGLIVYHLLTGHHALPHRRGPSRAILPQMIEDRSVTPPALCKFNRAISPAVEAIVRRCLEPDPAKRYASARQLAEDIERHRMSMPLKHTAEPSLVERAVKWARRHPKVASPTTFSFLIAALMLMAITWKVQSSLDQKSRDLEIRREQALGHFHQFQSEFQLAQDLLTADDPAQLVDGLKQGEQVLSKYEVVKNPQWLSQPIVQELSPPDRDRLKADVGEMAFLMARAVHLQPAADADVAKRFNQIAENHLGDGATAALAHQRASLTGQPLEEIEAKRLRILLASVEGLNGRGRYLLACEHVAQGRPREALRLLDAAVAENPDDFGLWFLKARCHQMIEQDTEALAAYGTSIALRPTYARAYVARASVYYTQRKHLLQARQDLDQAIKLKPDLLEARIDRGLVFFAMNKLNEALQDLDWAIEQEGAPSRIWFIRSRVKRAKGDREGADRDHARGLETVPTDAVSWVSRGIAKLNTDAEAALADFVEAEKLMPRCIDALNNQAYVYAVRLKKTDMAIAVMDRLLKRFPENQQAIGYRAILMARAGRIDEAVEEARTLAKSTLNPESIYRAACALSIASEKNPALKTESLRLLATAISRGWGQDKLESDKDLNPLRETSEFKQFAAYTRTMRSWTTPSSRE